MFNIGLENQITKNYFPFFFLAVFTEESNLIVHLDLKHQFRNSNIKYVHQFIVHQFKKKSKILIIF